jgi:hypothetical protein
MKLEIKPLQNTNNKPMRWKPQSSIKKIPSRQPHRHHDDQEQSRPQTASQHHVKTNQPSQKLSSSMDVTLESPNSKLTSEPESKTSAASTTFAYFLHASH